MEWREELAYRELIEEAAEGADTAALERYLNGLIAQAIGSGDPISISLPTGSCGGSAITALIAAIGSADREGSERDLTMLEQILDDLTGTGDRRRDPQPAPESER